MKRLKNITILLCFLSLLAFISCSAEDKMGGGETETIETIESKDFPADLLGQYRDDKVYNLYSQNETKDTLFRQIKTGGIKVILIKGTWLKDSTTGGSVGEFRIEKWTKTTKGGKTIKLEGKDSSGKEATVTYDYASGTLSGTYTDGSGTYLFNGKRIGDSPI